MLKKEIKNIAKARFKDAKILYKAKRYAGSIYICGYVIELALKNAICKKLNWPEYPPAKDNYKSFLTHNLDVLLSLTGKEKVIKRTFLTEWSNIKEWNPEVRYNPGGKTTQKIAQVMINSTSTLFKNI